MKFDLNQNPLGKEAIKITHQHAMRLSESSHEGSDKRMSLDCGINYNEKLEGVLLLPSSNGSVLKK
jgi:hypothetical protein